MFSVIIPTYNHAHFLRRALQCVIDQTHGDWECVIVDNHSTDNTEEVVASFNDPRLRLLKIRNNGVIAASRNKGIAEARGEWIAFLDSDDYWYPGRLAAVAAEIARNPGLDVVSTDEVVVHQDTGPGRILRYGPYCERFYEAMLVDGNRLSTSATVVRRAFMEQHALRFREDKEFITVEDYDLWLRIARLGAAFAFLRTVSGEYLLHGANSSGNVERHYRNLRAMLRDHVFTIQDFTEDRERLWKRVSARVDLGEAFARLGAGDRAHSVKLAARAVAQAPLHLAGYLLQRARRSREFKKLAPQA